MDLDKHNRQAHCNSFQCPFNILFYLRGRKSSIKNKTIAFLRTKSRVHLPRVMILVEIHLNYSQHNLEIIHETYQHQSHKDYYLIPLKFGQPQSCQPRTSSHKMAVFPLLFSINNRRNNFLLVLLGIL